jgi:hypothetical protein
MCFNQPITGATAAVNVLTGLYLTSRGHPLARTQVRPASRACLREDAAAMTGSSIQRGAPRRATPGLKRR